MAGGEAGGSCGGGGDTFTVARTSFLSSFFSSFLSSFFALSFSGGVASEIALRDVEARRRVRIAPRREARRVEVALQAPDALGVVRPVLDDRLDADLVLAGARRRAVREEVEALRARLDLRADVVERLDDGVLVRRHRRAALADVRELRLLDLGAEADREDVEGLLHDVLLHVRAPGRGWRGRCRP